MQFSLNLISGTHHSCKKIEFYFKMKMIFVFIYLFILLKKLSCFILNPRIPFTFDNNFRFRNTVHSIFCSHLTTALEFGKQFITLNPIIFKVVTLFIRIHYHTIKHANSIEQYYRHNIFTIISQSY